MTVGKIIELVVGKAGVLNGFQGYGTAFGEAFGNADKVCNHRHPATTMIMLIVSASQGG